MFIRLIISILFTFVLTGVAISAGILTTTFEHNGGSSCINTDHSYESAIDLMRFGIVNGSYEYGGASKTSSP